MGSCAVKPDVPAVRVVPCPAGAKTAGRGRPTGRLSILAAVGERRKCRPSGRPKAWTKCDLFYSHPEINFPTLAPVSCPPNVSQGGSGGRRRARPRRPFSPTKLDPSQANKDFVKKCIVSSATGGFRGSSETVAPAAQPRAGRAARWPMAAAGSTRAGGRRDCRAGRAGPDARFSIRRRAPAR